MNMASPATPFLESYHYVNVSPYGLRLDVPQERLIRLDRRRRQRREPPISHFFSQETHPYQQATHVDASLGFGESEAERIPSSTELLPTLPLACDRPPRTRLQVHPTTSSAGHLPQLPPSPLTPQLHSTAASPSLSSTITTLQSTPNHTPVQYSTLTPEQWRDQWNFDFTEPIRTKRKFNLRRAKRLPSSLSSGGGSPGIWQVHAAVIDLGGVLDATTGYGTGRESRGAYEAASTVERDRSVHFTGVRSKRDSGGYEGEKATTNDSSFTLSKFKFPAPPDSHWAESFGHLRDSGPPRSPTTLHFRGVSFNVVNPHESLSLEHKAFETPAEIDCLLDDYFHDRESITPSLNEASAEMLHSQDSLSSSDGARRGRMLYNDAGTARNQILRLPSEDAAHQPTDMTHPSLDRSASEVENESSAYTRTHFSNPFDLHLSADSGQHDFDHIDNMVASGYGEHLIDDAESLYPAPLSLGRREPDNASPDVGMESKGERADEGVTRSEDETTQLYDKLLDGYDYTRTSQAAADSFPASSSSIEAARTKGKEKAAESTSNPRAPTSPPMGDLWPFKHQSHQRTASINTSIAASEDDPSLEAVEYMHGSGLGPAVRSFMPRFSQPAFPPPSRRAPTPPSRVQTAIHAETTDLPSSQHTYGSTGALLDTSPYFQKVYQDCQKLQASSVTTRQTQQLPTSAGPSTSTYTPGLPDDWLTYDVGPDNATRRSTGSARVSSITDDGIWDEINLTDERPVSRDGVYHSEEQEADSNTIAAYIAEVDPVLVSTQNGVAVGPREAHLDAYHRQPAVISDDIINRIVQLLKKKIMEDVLMGHGFTANFTQRQRDTTELATLRRLHNTAFRVGTDIVAEEYPNLSPEQCYQNLAYGEGPGASRVYPNNTVSPDSYEQIMNAASEAFTDQSLNSAFSYAPAVSNQGLRFSPTQNTFATARETPSPLFPTRPMVAWTPLGRSTHHDPSHDPDAIELIVPSRLRSRTAVTSQTQLRPLRSSTALRVPTIPSAECARGWRHAVHSAACDADCGHMLLDPALARTDPSVLAEQKDISNFVLLASGVCPPLALAMACRALGGLASRLSDGRVTEMGARQTRRARYVALPVSCGLWLLVGLLVAVVVVVTRRP